MKNNKMENYKLKGSIHTIAIKSPEIEDVDEGVKKCIQYGSRDEVSYSKINVNDLLGDVRTYEEFQTSLETILAGAGVSEYDITRFDMRFDSYDEEHYKKFAKLNKYILSALAVTYKVKNAYKSNGLFSQKQLSVAIKNSYFEGENYDKQAASEGKDPACSRLELRTKRIETKDLKPLFMKNWFLRLDKAMRNLKRAQRRYNEELEKIYKAEKEEFPKKFRSLTDFIIQYQDCIFTKEQLVDLLSRFEEVKDPVVRAENHKKRYGIEYFSKKDVEAAVAEIKRAAEEFFEG